MVLVTFLATILLSFSKEPSIQTIQENNQCMPRKAIYTQRETSFCFLDEGKIYQEGPILFTEGGADMYTFSSSEVKDYFAKGEKYEKIAKQYIASKNYDKAKRYNRKALKTLKKALKEAKKSYTKDAPALALIYHRLGLLSSYLNKLPKTIVYLNKAWSIYSLHDKAYQKELAKITKELSTAYYIDEQCLKAIEVTEQNLDLIQKYDEPYPLEQARNLYNLGHLHECNGNYTQSEMYHRQALDLLTIIGADQDPENGIFYHGLALVLLKQGKKKAAKEQYLTMIHLKETHPMWEDIRQAKSYGNLALIYYEEGDYAKAEEYYTQSLTITKKFFGDEHMDTIEAYHTLAVVLATRAKYHLAFLYYQKVVHIQEKKLPKNHYKIGHSYNDLAFLYIDIGDYEQAMTCLKKVLNLTNNHYEYLIIAQAHVKISYLHYLMGNYKIAQKAYTYFFRRYKNSFVEQHLYMIEANHGFALLQLAFGKHKSSKKLLKKVLQIREEAFGQNHPETANSFYGLCITYYTEGLYADAFSSCFKALNIRIQYFGENHPQTAHAYNMVATLFYEVEHNTYWAEKYYQKAIDIYFTHFHYKHLYLPIFYHNLATVYVYQGRYQDALKLYKRAFEIRKKLLGAGNVDTLASLERVTWIKKQSWSLSRYIKLCLSFFRCLWDC